MTKGSPFSHQPQNKSLILMVIFILLAISSASSPIPFVALIFGYLAYRQFVAYRLVGYYHLYQDLMFNRGITNIERLAKHTRQTPQYVYEKLNNLVRQGYFPTITINRDTGEIMLPGAPIKPAGAGRAPDSAVMEAYTCTACKASCQKPRGVLTCEYCGSPLARNAGQ